MNRRYKFIFFLVLACFAFVLSSATLAQANNAPVVTNVYAQQRPGTRLIDIGYDVADADGDLLEITVVVSNDGGATYGIVPAFVTGDVGDGISPGVGKRIVWDVERDRGHIKGEGFKVRVIANDTIFIIGGDGAKMALVAAGEFEMGTASSEIPGLVEWAKKWYINRRADLYKRETPRHTVYVDAFYMDVYEVTNAQYQQFMEATGHSAPVYWSNSSYNAPEQPVVAVGWLAAVAYAEWSGKRLPTEAEWEKAARGGLSVKKFPWGDSDPDGTQCNFADSNTDHSWSDDSVDDGYKYAAPVGSYLPNGYGLYDMAGNALEWCADWYYYSYYSSSPDGNPVGPDSGRSRVVRGGSWPYGADYLRVAYRDSHGQAPSNSSIGFRCVSQD